MLASPGTDPWKNMCNNGNCKHIRTVYKIYCSRIADNEHWHFTALRPSFSTKYQRTHHASKQIVFVFGVGWDISCPRCQVFSRTPGWHTTHQSQQISSAYISLSLQHIQKVLQCESALRRRDYSQALKRGQHFYLCLWAIASNVQLSAEFSHFLSKEHVNGMTLLSK